MRTSKVLLSSNSPEWYTPTDLAHEIAAFLGHIDLDPCARGSQSVPAKHHEIGNGLAIPWRGKVYCNPPYGRTIGKWIRKAVTEPLDEIVLLVPARTDAAWFQPLYTHSLCFIRGRLRFANAQYSAPFPSVLAYIGPRHQEFACSFAHRGTVVRSVPVERHDLWAGVA